MKAAVRAFVGQRWARKKQWAFKGGGTVLDQGLFSGANFLVNILLARWLAPKEYGAFAVVLSVFYLLAGVHTAVLTEPMMVFGAGKWQGQFRKYSGMLIYGHAGLSLGASLLLGLVALVMSHLGFNLVAVTMAGLVVASPFMLLFWFSRRACYAQKSPAKAVVGSGINLTVVIIGLLFLQRQGMLTAFSGIILLGIGAGSGAFFVLLTHLQPNLRVSKENSGLNPATVTRDHWEYGAWNLLSMITDWASGQLLMWIVPLLLGLAASGVIAAIWNLYKPLNLLLQSFTLMLLPLFSHWAYRGKSSSIIKQRAFYLAALFGGISLMYSVGVVIAGHPLLHFLYRGKYDQYTPLLAIASIPWIMAMVITALLTPIRAFGKTRDVFWVWGASALFVILSAIPAVRLWGVKGALLVFAASYTITAVLAFVKVNHLGQSPSGAYNL